MWVTLGSVLDISVASPRPIAVCLPCADITLVRRQPQAGECTQHRLAAEGSVVDRLHVDFHHGAAAGLAPLHEPIALGQIVACKSKWDKIQRERMSRVALLGTVTGLRRPGRRTLQAERRFFGGQKP